MPLCHFGRPVQIMVQCCKTCEKVAKEGNIMVDELFLKYYEKFNENDKNIAKYVLNHKQLIPNLSTDELAKKCLVSRSTIMRFAQKVGLTGYGELKILIKLDNETIPQIKGSFVDLVCDNDVKIIEHFRHLDMSEICQKFSKAQRIFVYGTGSVQRGIANEFKRMFLNLGMVIDVIAGEGEFIQTARVMNPNDIIFIISKTGESVFLRQHLPELQLKGISIISLTNAGNNHLAQMSDDNIFVSIERHTTIDNYYFDTMLLMYLVVEILFAKYVEFLRKKAKKEKY